MGLFINLFVGLVHLVAVILDITFVFTVAQILSLWWPRPLLLAFANAGRPFIDGLIQRLRIDRIRRGRPGLSERKRLALLLLLVCLVRLALGFVVSLMVQSHVRIL